MRPDSPPDPERSAPEIVIITGLSGAGRSTAAKALEDLDWFVADNLPADLLPTMADLARRASGAVPRLAAVVDIRSRAFSTDLKSAIGDLNARGVRTYVVFLEAVVKYVLSQPGATDFLDAFVRAVQVALAGYDRTGRHFVQLAVGCTGGKHRSVVMAEEMAARLSQSWPGIQVTHRDLGRE